MEKVTFVIITLILTSVIVQESTGKITIVMHHGNIRHRPTKKQNRHSVEDSKGSKTSKKPQRPRHLINKLMVSRKTPNVYSISYFQFRSPGVQI